MVGNIEEGSTRYWFEYGPTGAYGSSTTPAARWLRSRVGSPVTAVVDGLEPDTEYHYRLCGEDAEGVGGCGADRTVRTTPTVDSVLGSAVHRSIVPELGAVEAASVHAASASDGTAPTGRASTMPGSDYFRYPDSGPVTCLRVDGNRATVGFEVINDAAPPPPEPPRYRLIVVEDNGPTGDRVLHQPFEGDPTACPAPTAELRGDRDPVEQGNFTVHDTP